MSGHQLGGQVSKNNQGTHALSLALSGFCSKDLQKQADGGWECSTQNQLQTCRKEGESAFSWHPYPAAPGQRRAAIFLA